MEYSVGKFYLEKAYDRIAHDFLFEVLLKFGFLENVVGWVKLLYSRAQSQVLVKGNLNQAFQIQMGLRQGCPLSPRIFICAMELLHRG